MYLLKITTSLKKWRHIIESDPKEIVFQTWRLLKFEKITKEENAEKVI